VYLGTLYWREAIFRLSGLHWRVVRKGSGKVLLSGSICFVWQYHLAFPQTSGTVPEYDILWPGSTRLVQEYGTLFTIYFIVKAWIRQIAAESMFTRPGHWPWLHLVRWHHRVLGWNGLVSRHEGVNGEQT
jgi:hypothetical protein